MVVLKSLKLPVSLVFMAVLLVACFVFYLPSIPFESKQKHKSLRALTSTEYRELDTVLRNATMMDRTVILTTLNEAWAKPNSVIDLFLESFQIGEDTANLLNHLVIIAMDQKAFNRCKSIHAHCFSIVTEGVDFSTEKRFMTEQYLKLMWTRIEFLQIVLELGYNFVFTDADVMWLRNPFPQLPTGVDLTIACDIFSGSTSDLYNTANGGFYYVKSNAVTVQFYRYWYMARELHPGRHDQDVFNIIKHDRVVYKMGIRMRFLDTAYFGGFCEASKDLNKVCTMHANCCVGIERKLHDLKLVLEDWSNFTALSSKEKKLTKTSWRAPDNCKWWN